MAARKNRGTTGGSLNKEWKEKIRAGVMADRFYKCFMGEVELSPTQIKAGEVLFKRIEPELKSTETVTTLQNPDGTGIMAGVQFVGVDVKAGAPK